VAGSVAAEPGLARVTLEYDFLPVAHAIASSSFEPRVPGCRRFSEREGKTSMRRGDREEYEGERGICNGVRRRWGDAVRGLAEYAKGSRVMLNGG
jgi:hypothetical protein